MSYFSGDDGHDYYWRVTRVRVPQPGQIVLTYIDDVGAVDATTCSSRGLGREQWEGRGGRTKARSLARRRGWEICEFIGDGGSRWASLVPPPGNGDCC